jgi:hypothetical protein
MLTPEQEAAMFGTDGDPTPRADRTDGPPAQWMSLYRELYPEPQEAAPDHPCKFGSIWTIYWVKP